MKKVLVLAGLLASQMSFADAGSLEGKSYCRTLSTGGLGQPAGEGKHCIKFSKGTAMDNANTFFGNPPEFSPYSVEGMTVTFGSSVYELSEDGSTLTTVKGSAVKGIVLTLE